jgi:hypothetical protein
MVVTKTIVKTGFSIFHSSCCMVIYRGAAERKATTQNSTEIYIRIMQFGFPTEDKSKKENRTYIAFLNLC